jgi:hypothetical protein
MNYKLEEQKKKANAKHNHKFDYTKVNYRTTRDMVIIGCPIHGDFEQEWNSHLCGYGCKKCAIDKTKKIDDDATETFKARSISMHGDRFDYTKTFYTGFRKKLIITCRVHGDFEQTPMMHYRSEYGCRKCAIDSITYTIEDLVKNGERVHGKKFDYSKAVVNGNKKKVIIICDKGHEFVQRPNDHTQGRGCNICSEMLVTSKGEKDLCDFVSSIYNGKIIENSRNVIKPLEIDIYLPDLNIAIEYNGLYRHSETHKSVKYHYNKWKLCLDIGIRLIHIWEHEWANKNELCKSYLHDIIISGQTKICADKLEIRNVKIQEHKEFLEKYHFQEYFMAETCFGLYDHNNKLLQILSLKTLDHGYYEIENLCTVPNTLISGGYKKLLKYVLSNIHMVSLISYNNLDKFTWDIYNDMGFEMSDDIIESYFYIKQKETVSANEFRQQHVSEKNDISLTESKIASSKGFTRVFHVGHSKHIITP